MLCRYMLDQFVLSYHLTTEFLCLIFFLGDLYIGEWKVLKSPTTTVLGSVCGFSSNVISFLKLGVIVFGTSMFRMVISCWKNFHLISIKSPPYLISSNVGLKSVLSDLRLAMPACFLVLEGGCLLVSGSLVAHTKNNHIKLYYLNHYLSH